VITAGQLLGRVWRAAGGDVVYGEPWPGLDVVEVPPAVAPTLAAAHRRVRNRSALVHEGDGRFRVAGGSGAPADHDGPGGARPLLAAAPTELVDALPELARGVDLDATFDPTSPTDDVWPPAAPGPERWQPPEADVVARIAQAVAPVVLVGPGVVQAGMVSGFHALAVALSAGTLNTWGAKGVLHWQSRHHWATIGLQARDFELAGLADTDLIVASGLDPLESPDERWRLAPAVELDPRSLAPMAEQVGRPWRPLAVPPLRDRLASVTQAGWARSGSPLHPARATLDLHDALGPGGLVAADPGIAGFWVARTFGTTELGSVLVPADGSSEGFAAACVLVARLHEPNRAALAVVDGPPSDEVAAVLDAARRLGVPVAVEAWSAEGERLDQPAHRARAEELARGQRVGVASVAIDPAPLDEFAAAAGRIIAWT
jgi:hypothetical protein